MKLNRKILTRLVTEAMTNLDYEDINPSNEPDGIESVEQEKEEYNPLDDESNHMYENYNNMRRLTGRNLNRFVNESVKRSINEITGLEDNGMQYIIDKLDKLGQEASDIGQYGLSEDINEIIQKYR